MPRPNRMRTSVEIQERARELRQRMTPTEQRLWQALRRHGLAGLKFRRQHPLGPFIADFYCAPARLVVEIDGPIHADRQEQDQARAAYLEALDYRILRFSNEEVQEQLEQVVRTIAEACQVAE